MNITPSALFCWVSNVLHSVAACKFLTGYNKVCVKTLIHLLHRVVMSPPFACSSQAVPDSFSLLHFKQDLLDFLQFLWERCLSMPTQEGTC